MATAEEITRHEEADPDGVEWVDAAPVVRPIAVVESDATWPAQFEELAQRIREALGEGVVALAHVGSTSVPGLAAKPIIDIDLTIADSRHEAAYVPALVGAGFSLVLREPRWHEHRLMVMPSPRANLHVWSPDSPEAIRHIMFRDWLRDHPDDRATYAEAKRNSATASTAAGEDVMSYNLRKEPVIREILDRIFRSHGLLPEPEV